MIYLKLGFVVAYHGNSIEDAKMALENYCGEYESEIDYTKQFINDNYSIHDFLQGYIDYDKIAYDLFIGDYYSVCVGGRFYVFRGD